MESLNLTVELQHKPQEIEQPMTRALMADVQRNVSFGSVEPKITNGKITHIMIKQSIKAID